jgi:hypothetical protein
MSKPEYDGQEIDVHDEPPEGCDDRLSPGHIQALSDNFHVAPMRQCLMPSVAEAKARLAEIERERAQLRAFIRNEERIAKKHPTGHLKGME